MDSKPEGIYEYCLRGANLIGQLCPVCKEKIGLMPGGRDSMCHNCGFKDPCCE